ncbi:stage II sporulation protein M [Clostridium sediminicola]|uniref:stage II sporulation protein M n=1 Tax=Clostridium sediminicola TaxID=3114879 RepID=UPI0031F270D9
MKNYLLNINLNKRIKESLLLYIITLLCICTGIVLGIYAVKYMGKYEKTELLNYLNNFLVSVDKTKVNNIEVLVQAIKNNLPVIIAIWFLGLTMVGMPIILIIDTFKGFSLGFSISFLMKELGGKGIGITLLSIIPQNIIYIPLIILSSVFAMEFSLNLLNKDSYKNVKESIFVTIVSYSSMYILIIIVMFIGFFIEAFIIPNVVKLIV